MQAKWEPNLHPNYSYKDQKTYILRGTPHRSKLAVYIHTCIGTYLLYTLITRDPPNRAVLHRPQEIAVKAPVRHRPQESCIEGPRPKPKSGFRVEGLRCRESGLVGLGVS